MAITLHEYHALAQRLDQNPAAATFDDLQEIVYFEGENSTRVKALRDRLVPRPVVVKSAPQATAEARPQKRASIPDDYWDSITKSIHEAVDDTLHTGAHRRMLDEKLLGFFKGLDARGEHWAYPVAQLMAIVDRLNGKAIVRNRRIVELEKRIEQLEKRPVGLSYAGLWAADATYEKHEGVTHSGSLWVALERTTGVQPGTDERWQLCCKRGRDSRDRRGE